VCIEVGLRPRKLNILLKTRLVLFLDIVFFVFTCLSFIVCGICILFCCT
jgi:hypothetical protein